MHFPVPVVASVADYDQLLARIRRPAYRGQDAAAGRDAHEDQCVLGQFPQQDIQSRRREGTSSCFAKNPLTWRWCNSRMALGRGRIGLKPAASVYDVDHGDARRACAPQYFGRFLNYTLRLKSRIGHNSVLEVHDENDRPRGIQGLLL